MQEQTLNELDRRASERLEDSFHEVERKLSASKAIKTELDAMRSEDKILMLSEEEERMLRAFRAFRNRCNPGSVFKWQTRPNAEVIVVESTGLILDPQEAL